ncbi:MAG: hypothetical protein Q8P46_18345 [Hyphomicrobiales bacterium]|nr:hypothetical protein [Hyphomicrobiales bacterium]
MTAATSGRDRREIVPGVSITAAPGSRHDEILTPEALGFVAELQRRFEAQRRRGKSRAPRSGSGCTTRPRPRAASA